MATHIIPPRTIPRIPLITRRPFSSGQVDQLRAAVELARQPDAWMSAHIRALDPFQRAADHAESNWFRVAQYVCYPLRQLPRLALMLAEEEAQESEQSEQSDTGGYPDPASNPYYGVRL